MNEQEIFQQIFNRPADELGNKSFLQKITAQFPYFGLAHFYALKNTAFHATDFNTIAAKTNLFFKSTHYLNALLHAKNDIDEKVSAQIDTIQEKEAFEATDVVIEFMNPEEKPITKTNDLETENFIAEEKETIDASANELVSDEIIVEKMEALKKAMVQQDDQMFFEPLHASDYFASQGIKLSEAQLADDKLGKQLKSFTSWLKTMKKVHPEKLPIPNVTIEKAIQTQAEKSNVEEDIYTEAMAEAYLLQGKETKAIEIYSKLSLMIPSKSTYFATKIDSLKK